MTTFQIFVNAAAGTFWTIRSNEDSKHVATTGGRLGTRGYTRRFHFPSRDEVRDYVSGRIDTKLDKGFVQVA
jgi:predicted DNA-binding WGR domain protein